MRPPPSARNPAAVLVPPCIKLVVRCACVAQATAKVTLPRLVPGVGALTQWGMDGALRAATTTISAFTWQCRGRPPDAVDLAVPVGLRNAGKLWLLCRVGAPAAPAAVAPPSVSACLLRTCGNRAPPYDRVCGSGRVCECWHCGVAQPNDCHASKYTQTSNNALTRWRIRLMARSSCRMSATSVQWMREVKLMSLPLLAYPCKEQCNHMAALDHCWCFAFTTCIACAHSTNAQCLT